jgi:uncharacterized protein YdiU (UPF0061 family)
VNAPLLPSLSWRDRFVRELPGDPERHVATRQVHGAVWSAVRPTPVPAPRVLAWSAEVAAELGLSDADVQSEAFASVFGGNHVPGETTPFAANYGGHQFGHWAGQLGDGRAITLGTVQPPSGPPLELQLKGAGPTPYSRHADGRAVLRSSVREFLCSEAMHHLGIPTTRALCLIDTGEGIVRDPFYDGNPVEERGAIVCRVAPSFLRLGSYELPSSRQDADTLRELVAYTLRHHFPELGDGPDKDTVLAWLREVARRTAHTVAGWMRVGFVHGVMNTDNLSVLGVTVDYGPYGWIDGYDPDWTPNTTDAGQRRYRFGAQYRVAGWNLSRFAEALYPLVGDVPALQEALDVYPATWAEAWGDTRARKLGLAAWRADDEELWTELEGLLVAVETDMTIVFRALAEVPVRSDAPTALLAPLQPAFYTRPAPHHVQGWVRWLRRWSARLAEDGRSDDERIAQMNAANPRYVLRNYLAQQVIEQAQAGDPSGIAELLDVMRRPYDEQPGRERFAQKRPEWARHKPGCSTLSCSS